MPCTRRADAKPNSVRAIHQPTLSRSMPCVMSIHRWSRPLQPTPTQLATGVPVSRSMPVGLNRRPAMCPQFPGHQERRAVPAEALECRNVDSRPPSQARPGAVRQHQGLLPPTAPSRAGHWPVRRTWHHYRYTRPQAPPSSQANGPIRLADATLKNGSRRWASPPPTSRREGGRLAHGADRRREREVSVKDLRVAADADKVSSPANRARLDPAGDARTLAVTVVASPRQGAVMSFNFDATDRRVHAPGRAHARRMWRRIVTVLHLPAV